MTKARSRKQPAEKLKGLQSRWFTKEQRTQALTLIAGGIEGAMSRRRSERRPSAAPLGGEGEEQGDDAGTLPSRGPPRTLASPG
jgi:hypothetical protein